jgi:hypothetical protein
MAEKSKVVSAQCDLGINKAIEFFNAKAFSVGYFEFFVLKA